MGGVKEAVEETVEKSYKAVAKPVEKVGDMIGNVYEDAGDIVDITGDLMKNGASDPLGFMLGSNSKERLARMQEETALLKRRLGSGAIDEENALTKRKRFDPLKAGLASTIATSPLGTGGDLTPSNGGKINLG